MHIEHTRGDVSIDGENVTPDEATLVAYRILTAAAEARAWRKQQRAMIEHAGEAREVSAGEALEQAEAR